MAAGPDLVAARVEAGLLDPERVRWAAALGRPGLGGLCKNRDLHGVAFDAAARLGLAPAKTTWGRVHQDPERDEEPEATARGWGIFARDDNGVKEVQWLADFESGWNLIGAFGDGTANDAAAWHDIVQGAFRADPTSLRALAHLDSAATGRATHPTNSDYALILGSWRTGLAWEDAERELLSYLLGLA